MIEIATLAGGCFWCTEAIYKRLKGVKSVMPGYAGGNVENPTYEEVCTGNTGHAESIQIEYDPKIILYGKLLDIFWRTHDPTSVNRQGQDTGPQYRSVVFYHNENQKITAEKLKAMFEKEKVYRDPIVTEILPFTNFYPAEDYHNNYFEKNKNNLYCKLVIDPKIKKLLKDFPEEVKTEI